MFLPSKQVLRAQVAKEREENQVSICLEWQENLAPVLRLVSTVIVLWRKKSGRMFNAPKIIYYLPGFSSFLLLLFRV